MLVTTLELASVHLSLTVPEALAQLDMPTVKAPVASLAVEKAGGMHGEPLTYSKMQVLPA